MKLSISSLLIAGGFRTRTRLDHQRRDLRESRMRSENGDVAEVTDRAVVIGLSHVSCVTVDDGTRTEKSEHDEGRRRSELYPSAAAHARNPDN
jgi:hypothetical protein